jgi:hypothetical protein
MTLLSRIFNNQGIYIQEHEALIKQLNLFKSTNRITDHQKAKSQLVYYEAVYDYHLSQVIKYTPDSLGNRKYEFRYVSALTLFMVDKEIKTKAELITNKLIKKNELYLPDLLDLDNPTHYIFAYRITDRFESVVRKYGLDDYSLKENGLVMIEEHKEQNLLDYKGIIYNSLVFLRDYQNSSRKDQDLAMPGDYFEELINKLDSFK